MSDKIKIVNRTIHPKTHDMKNSYRVKIGKRNYYEKLIVNINHENLDFRETYAFDGNIIKEYESIHFKAIEYNRKIQIQWVQDIQFTKET